MRKLIMSMMLIITSIIFTGCSGLFYNNVSYDDEAKQKIIKEQCDGLTPTYMYKLVDIACPNFDADKYNSLYNKPYELTEDQKLMEAIKFDLGFPVEYMISNMSIDDIDKAREVLETINVNDYIIRHNNFVSRSILYADRLIMITNIKYHEDILRKNYPQYDSILRIVYEILVSCNGINIVETFKKMGINVEIDSRYKIY